MESWMLEIGSTGMMAWVLWYILAKLIPQQRKDLIDFLDRNMDVLDRLEKTQAKHTTAIQQLALVIHGLSQNHPVIDKEVPNLP